MSKDELQEEVNQLKAKLEKTEMDFEAYKASAKQLEQFLEQQSSKKQGEIRRMKQEFILKEKGFKQSKQELSMLQNDYAQAKAQLAKLTQGGVNAEKSAQDLKKMEAMVQTLQKNIHQLTTQLLQKDKQLGQERQSWEEKLKAINADLDSKTQRITELEQENSKLSKKAASSTQQKPKPEPTKKQQPQIDTSATKKEVEAIKAQLQKQKDKHEEKIKKTEKQLRAKINALLQQNEALQNRTVNVTIGSGSPSPMLIKTSLQDEDLSLRPSYHCLLLTKPHYISPFLEIYQDRKLIKIYKSTRTGCYEKSMGGYKHKFDRIAFDEDTLIEPIVQRIKNYEEETEHSVVFFGVKKTNKKYLMSKMMLQLKDFLLQKLENASQMEALFMKRSPDEEKNLLLKANDESGIADIIEKVIAIGCKSDKPKSLVGSRKVQPKPKVRYFRLRIDDFSLEIGTSSYTALSFRDKTSVTTMLNNILFSKLPNILQSSLAQKYLVLTLNPIVDLYEDCKNTLSTTFCKFVQEEAKLQNDSIMEGWKNSPVRGDELNDLTKKKLEGFQRQNQEISLKIRKLQDECTYYKARFDELQFRLKNLLNTHAAQNTYLKKSPVTLSYQKLLKFVHSVQQRNGIAASLSHGTSMMLKSGIYTDKDLESLQAL